jgi:hypothetical protein
MVQGCGHPIAVGARVLSFQRVETFLDAPEAFLSGITDLEAVPVGAGFRLYSATRPGGGLLAIDMGETMVLNDLAALPAGQAVPAPARLDRAMIGGLPTLLVTGGSSERLGGYRLDPDGGIGAQAQITGSPAGAVAALAWVTADGGDYCYAARLGDSGILVSRLLANGRMEEVARLPLGADWQGVDVADLAPVRIGETAECASGLSRRCRWHADRDGQPWRGWGPWHRGPCRH